MTAVADILVVGAGPAGLMAALTAAAAGRRVLVLERLGKPGIKLLATGGGRCNLTNVLPPKELMARFGRQGRFMEPALRGLDNLGLLEFFAGLGVPAHCADGFHWFPQAESAAAVQAALWQHCESLGVRFLFNCRATGLLIRAGTLAGVATEQGELTAAKVILAAGGKSWPMLGSDGSGLALAAVAGHTVKPLFPALVPLIVREPWVPDCAGTVFPEAEAWIDLPKRRGIRTCGPVLFTHRGISGPVILDLSGDVAMLLAEMPEVPLRLRWHQDAAEIWRGRIAGWRRQHGARLLRNLLDQHLPANFATALAKASAAADLKMANLTADQEATLVECLTELPLHVTATEGFAKSMATRGGISLKEIRPESLESRLVAGLFFAGEIVDLDGPCGGFNLQWAFSSGRLAGRAMSLA
jgi:predicted Rossmann fold flavoprotein